MGDSTEENISRIRKENPGLKEIDATGKCVFPAWCDSHTHLVYAASREQEFTDRLRGISYAEIARRGGGINESARRLRLASEEELFQSASGRLREILALGTGTVEIKSGYGLDVESELKMLRVIRRLRSASSMTIKSTFLGAHAVPETFRGNKRGYLDLILKEMLPAIGAEGLAEYCDIFCEANYFTAEDTMELMDAAVKHGMTPKVHAEQLSHSGGIEAGVKSGAISVDHLEYIDAHDMELLRQAATMPVILPGAQLFLGLKKPPVREMIDFGLPVALASDFNPGSCPSGNMNQMVSLACILYGMLPEEAIVAATTNSAYAVNLSANTGSVAIGKRADVFITREIPSYSYLPYYFGASLVGQVILGGKIMDGDKF
jgi:imidazolonepropionase